MSGIFATCLLEAEKTVCVGRKSSNIDAFLLVYKEQTIKEITSREIDSIM